MAKTAKSIMDMIISYLGTTEDPKGSNNVIFNTDYYGHEVSGSQYAWCVTTVWDTFRKCGASDLFYDGEKTAGCVQVLLWGRRNGLEVNKNEGRYGDLILFDWDMYKEDDPDDADHIGFIVSKNSDGSYNTIEGNVDDMVAYRRRDDYIRAIIRPKYEEEDMDYTKFPKLYVGVTGHAVSVLQVVIGVVPSGIFDKNTEDKVKQYQKKKGLVQDGVAGKDTWKCMIEDMMNMKKYLLKNLVN